MRKRGRLAILIPIILDLGVLLILPTVVFEYGFGRGLLLGVVAFLAPWIPFIIISRAVDHEVSEERRDWESKQERDFV